MVISQECKEFKQAALLTGRPEGVCLFERAFSSLFRLLPGKARLAAGGGQPLLGIGLYRTF